MLWSLLHLVDLSVHTQAPIWDMRHVNLPLEVSDGSSHCPSAARMSDPLDDLSRHWGDSPGVTRLKFHRFLSGASHQIPSVSGLFLLSRVTFKIKEDPCRFLHCYDQIHMNQNSECFSKSQRRGVQATPCNFEWSLRNDVLCNPGVSHVTKLAFICTNWTYTF